MTGIDLKLQRIRARVKAQDLARAMDVSGSRVSVIEALAVVTDETARRYLDALATLTTIPTSATTSAAPHAEPVA